MDEAAKKINGFYDRHIDAHGGGARAVGWNDERSQEVRFAALCRVGDLNGRSVLDVGCGFGDLYGYLSERYGGVDYTGIDINPRYIARARNAYPDARFEVADIGEYDGGSFDYMLASGAFAVKIPRYKEVYFGHIARMFGMVRNGVACTMLNGERHPNDEEYAAYSVAEVFEFCRSLTDDAAIYRDYLAHDFTVVLRHTA